MKFKLVFMILIYVVMTSSFVYGLQVPNIKIMNNVDTTYTHNNLTKSIFVSKFGSTTNISIENIVHTDRFSEIKMIITDKLHHNGRDIYILKKYITSELGNGIIIFKVTYDNKTRYIRPKIVRINSSYFYDLHLPHFSTYIVSVQAWKGHYLINLNDINEYKEANFYLKGNVTNVTFHFTAKSLYDTLDNGNNHVWSNFTIIPFNGFVNNYVQYKLVINGNNIYVENSQGNIKYHGYLHNFWKNVNNTWLTDIRFTSNVGELPFWIEFPYSYNNTLLTLNYTAGVTQLTHKIKLNNVSGEYAKISFEIYNKSTVPSYVNVYVNGNLIYNTSLPSNWDVYHVTIPTSYLISDTSNTITYRLVGTASKVNITFTEIDYVSNDTNTVIWVNVTPGSNYIAMFYGNRYATISNYRDGNKVFLAFDNFTEGLSTQWTNILGTWSVKDGYMYIDPANYYYSSYPVDFIPGNVIVYNKRPFISSDIVVYTKVVTGYETTTTLVFNGGGVPPSYYRFDWIGPSSINNGILLGEWYYNTTTLDRVESYSNYVINNFKIITFFASETKNNILYGLFSPYTSPYTSYSVNFYKGNIGFCVRSIGYGSLYDWFFVASKSDPVNITGVYNDGIYIDYVSVNYNKVIINNSVKIGNTYNFTIPYTYLKSGTNNIKIYTSGVFGVKFNLTYVDNISVTINNGNGTEIQSGVYQPCNNSTSDAWINISFCSNYTVYKLTEVKMNNAPYTLYNFSYPELHIHIPNVVSGKNYTFVVTMIYNTPPKIKIIHDGTDVIFMNNHYIIHTLTNKPIHFSMEYKDYENNNISYIEWEFDDGSISHYKNVYHSFDKVGFYNVSLCVVDNGYIKHLSNVTNITIFVTGNKLHHNEIKTLYFSSNSFRINNISVVSSNNSITIIKPNEILIGNTTIPVDIYNLSKQDTNELAKVLVFMNNTSIIDLVQSIVNNSIWDGYNLTYSPYMSISKRLYIVNNIPELLVR